LRRVKVMSTANRSKPARETIPFPQSKGRRDDERPLDSVEDVQAAVETISRKIKDLARELNCLGYFDDDDDDRPRAA